MALFFVVSLLFFSKHPRTNPIRQQNSSVTLVARQFHSCLILLCYLLDSEQPGYGSIPIDTYLGGWTSIYQLLYFDVHQGYKVLTHPHLVTMELYGTDDPCVEFAPQWTTAASMLAYVLTVSTRHFLRRRGKMRLINPQWSISIESICVQVSVHVYTCMWHACGISMD